MLSAGTNVEWLRDDLQIIPDAAASHDVAAGCHLAKLAAEIVFILHRRDGTVAALLQPLDQSGGVDALDRLLARRVDRRDIELAANRRILQQHPLGAADEIRSSPEVVEPCRRMAADGLSGYTADARRRAGREFSPS